MNDTDSNAAVDQLADRYWERFLELNPTYATILGDERYDDRLEDPGPAGRAARRALAEETQAQLAPIDPLALDPDRRITADMLALIAQATIEADDLHLHVLEGVDQLAGPQTTLPQIAQFHRLDTPERLERFLARLRAYPDVLDAHATNLRDGIARGLTAPRVVVERTIAQLASLVERPPAEAVVPAVAPVTSDTDRERVRAVVAETVAPAERAYLAWLREAYLAASREEPGLWVVPDGEAIYRTLIRTWTTLDLTPETIHAIGLEALDRIDEERRSLAGEAGFGDDVEAYRGALTADPANVPNTPEALTARAAEDAERALAAVATCFGRLPRAACEVRAVEAFKEQDAPFAYYYPPAADGSRSGIYYINTFDLPSRLFTRLASTTYHEAIPGHHLQMALESEHPSLTPFRRFAARLVGGAYVEGWGLYAERLADELGLYRSAGERLGMLDAQAWRAARLVVDTGIHALHWPRQTAVEFLLRTGLSSTDASIETDRYIAWPGQALTYLLGQREIAGLRRDLTARHGERFDLRVFHDAVLGQGTLPLVTLRRELPGWYEARSGSATG